MHLTNYAINKKNDNFVKDTAAKVGGKEPCYTCNPDGTVPKSDTPTAGCVGSKRSLEWFFAWLKTEGHDKDALWGQIKDVVVRTLISAQVGARGQAPDTSELP